MNPSALSSWTSATWQNLAYILQAVGLLWSVAILFVTWRLHSVREAERQSAQMEQESQRTADAHSLRALQKIADEAQARAEELELGPVARPISRELFAQFEAALQHSPRGELDLEVIARDATALPTAENLRAVLTKLGFVVHPPVFTMRPAFHGCAILIKTEPDGPSMAGWIQDAFRACGLKMDAFVDPNSERPKLLVGSEPDAFREN